MKRYLPATITMSISHANRLAHDGRSLAVIILLFSLLIFASGSGHADQASACTARHSVSSGDHVKSILVDGRRRSYRVHIPPGYSADKPAAVVMAFHGGWGTGKYIQKQSKMNEVSDKQGFIGVFPDGLHRAWNAGACCEKPMRKNIDDVGFVSKLIDTIKNDYCVDSRRVYATGFSNGAMLSHRLACELSDKIAAIAPVSGVIMVKECKPTRPMSVMVFHGTEDPRSLWEGGLGDKDPSKGIRDSLPVTLNKLTTRYHCTDRVETTFSKGAVSCDSHPVCDGGEVTLCKINGAGHQWPGGKAVWEGRLGPMNTDISASALMWEFFERHPMPEKPAALSTQEPVTSRPGIHQPGSNKP